MLQSTDLPLRDIHLPEAIGFWPLAMGWWILAALTPLVIYFIYKLYRRLTRKTALKSAKKAFKKLRVNTALNERTKVIALSQLVRRTAMSLYPRAEVASLTGKKWLMFLDATVAEPLFNNKLGVLLIASSYQPEHQDYSLEALFKLVEQWLKQQKEPKK